MKQNITKKNQYSEQYLEKNSNTEIANKLILVTDYQFIL